MIMAIIFGKKKKSGSKGNRTSLDKVVRTFFSLINLNIVNQVSCKTRTPHTNISTTAWKTWQVNGFEVGYSVGERKRAYRIFL